MYLNELEGQVRKAFRFDIWRFSPQTSALYRRIQADPHSVSIHFSRGDYYKSGNVGMHGNICALEYYHRAIGMMRNKVSDARFYLFSDDPAWVRDHFPDLQGVIYVDWNKGADFWQDMALMSACSLHIISNSSFSWWGAWLVQPCPDHIVMVPDLWLWVIDEVEIVPPGWMHILT